MHKKERRRGLGFAQAGGLLADQIRTVSHGRGFAEKRVLTNWEDIVGPATAEIAQPRKVTYSKGGFGATLVITASGARAPMLQLQLDAIRTRVNAAYGYNAIQRVRIEQVSLQGMAEPQAKFLDDRGEAPAKLGGIDLKDVKDGEFRVALENLEKAVVRREREKAK